MKRVFGQELLENASSEIQALLQREEKKIKQRMEKKKSKMSQKFSILGGKFSVFGSFFDSGHRTPKSSALRKHSVNPIITILFVGMAIKTWRSFAQRKINGELLPDDSLPFVEEEEAEEEEEECEVSNPSKESSVSFDDEESPQSDSPSSFNANLKLSRRNADKNDEESASESDSKSKSSSKKGSSSSGSSMQSIDLERIRNEESKRGRRLERFSQINLIKGFLWNKLEGRPDPYRSSNMFVNFLSMHSNLSKTNLQGTSFRKNGLDENSSPRR